MSLQSLLSQLSLLSLLGQLSLLSQLSLLGPLTNRIFGKYAYLGACTAYPCE